MAFPTNANQVQAFAGAMYGQQIGSVTMAQVTSDIQASGGLANALNAYYSASFGSRTTASVAATVVANLGLTGQAATDGTAYITAQLTAAPAAARGAVIANILNLFSGLTADAAYGTAATAWNAKVDIAAAYSGAGDVAVGTIIAKAFNLTTGTDNGAAFTGTSAADSFNGTDTTYTAADSINGGAGADSLTLVFAGANTAVASASSIETVQVQNYHSAANTLNMTSFVGTTEVQNSGSTEAVLFSNVPAEVATVTIQNIATAKNTSVTYKDSATLGTTDALAVNLNGVTAAVTLTAQTTTANTGGIEVFNVNSTGANNTAVVTLAGALQTGVTVQTVVVTGDKNLKLAVADSMTTVNASALTGNLQATLSNTANFTATGGSGNDRFDFASALTSSDKVNGGAGVDRIAFTGITSSNLATAVNAKTGTVNNISNVEVLEYTGTAAYALDASLVTVAGLTGYATSGVVSGVAASSAAGSVGFAVTNQTNSNTFSFENNVTGGNGAYIASAAGGAGSAAVTFAPQVDNGSNVVDLSLTAATLQGGLGGKTSAAAGAGGVGLDVSGFETVNIHSLKAATGTTTNAIAGGTYATATVAAGSEGTGGSSTASAIIAAANTVFNIDGSNDINLGSISNTATATGAASVTINAGTLTGKLTVATGSSADTIVGGTNVNTITLNGGVDAVDITKSTAKADVITLASAAGTSSTLLPTIAGFTAAATTGDKLDILNTATVRADVAAGAVTGVTNLTASVTNGIVSFAGSAAATATLADKVNAVYSTNVLGTVQYNTVAFEHAGNTYVCEQGDTTATFLAATDLIVQLTGLTGVTALGGALAANTIFIA